MIIKFVHVILLAAVKFILTLPYAMVIGLKFEEALAAVLIGGIGGFLFFFYLSRSFVSGFNKMVPLFMRWVPLFVKMRYQAFLEKKKLKKVRIFTRKSRLIARLKRTYGLPGIIVTTPLFLTIPVGAFLASKYYSKTRHIVLYMILSIVGWTAVLSAVIHLFPKVFF
ncbi:MAG TPA: hypothetical protein VKA10_06730 [Prolixibacteraceae bacterium]|nr:hypothetical protein [Prolixibacteraceae bacterium]